MSGPIPPSEHVAAGNQNRSPVGTGPFRFTEWTSGDRILVEKFDGYRDALTKIIWQNTRPVVTHSLGALKDCGDAGYRHYDPKAAKALIDDYGQPVKIVMIHTATPRGRELGELMQQMMKPAGIELDLQPVDQSTLVKRVFTQDFGISGWRIADGADMGPQLFANEFSKSSYNLTGYSSPELDAVAMEMRTTPDRERRLDLQCKI